MKASAKKSYGEFKPVIVHDMGHGRKRTEIVGKNVKVVRETAQTKFGHSSERTVYKRGKTFADRLDAVAYAQKVIDRRNDAHEQHMQDYNKRQAQYAEQRAATP